MKNSTEYNKKYYQRNKEYFYELLKCDCGKQIPRYNMSKHKKTKKHNKIISNLLQTKSLVIKN